MCKKGLKKKHEENISCLLKWFTFCGLCAWKWNMDTLAPASILRNNNFSVISVGIRNMFEKLLHRNFHVCPHLIPSLLLHQRNLVSSISPHHKILKFSQLSALPMAKTWPVFGFMAQFSLPKPHRIKKKQHQAPTKSKCLLFLCGRAVQSGQQKQAPENWFDASLWWIQVTESPM